jgi:hypothetical protein
MQSIRRSDTEDTNDNRNPTYYLSKITHNPFPNIKFNNTSTKEIERIIKSIRVKNLHGYCIVLYCIVFIHIPQIQIQATPQDMEQVKQSI